MYIIWLLVLCFHGIPVCENVCLSMCLCLFFPSVCFILPQFGFCFVYLILLLFLDAYLFAKEKQKDVELDGRSGGGKLGGVGGHKQNIFYGKKKKVVA